MVINRVVCDVLHKGTLLLNCQRSANTTGFICFPGNFLHNTVGGILANDIIPNCQLKCRMQQSVDIIQCTKCQIFFVQKVKIKLEDLGILDVCNFLSTKGFSDISVVHISVVAASGFSQLEFGRKVTVKGIIDRGLTGYIQIKTVQLILYQLLFLFTKLSQIICVYKLAPTQGIGIGVHITLVRSSLNFSFPESSPAVVFSCFCHVASSFTK